MRTDRRPGRAGDRGRTAGVQGSLGRARGRGADGAFRHAGGRGNGRLLRAAAALLTQALSLAACDAERQAGVRDAGADLVGLAANDLRLCAGLPERTAAGTDGAEFWSYERSASPGGATVTLPQAGLNLSDREECRAVFELIGGRVTRVAFTRLAVARPQLRGACAPIIQECEALLARGALRRSLDPGPRPGAEAQSSGAR